VSPTLVQTLGEASAQDGGRMATQRLLASLLTILAAITVGTLTPPAQANPLATTPSLTGEGPPRPRTVQMIKCAKTTVDEAAETVRCRRTKTINVLAFKNGKSWQVESRSGLFTDVPYVWSPARKALVFSPALAWQQHVNQQYAHPPTSWLPRRIPERPLPPRPTPIEGQGSPDSYAFMDADSLNPKSALRFDRCTEIRWTADLSRAAAYGLDPDLVLSVASKAFADVSALTGYAFRYVGRSDGLLDGAHADVPERGARDWTHRADIGLTIGSDDDAAGYSFSTLNGDGGYTNLFSLADPIAGLQPISWGTIVLNGGLFAEEHLPFLPAPPDEFLAGLFRHELGHMLGLDHVGDTDQLMQHNFEVFDYANGDRQGLWALAAQPCFPAKVAHQVRAEDK